MENKSKLAILKDTHDDAATAAATGGTAIESSPDVNARLAVIESRLDALERPARMQGAIQERRKRQQEEGVINHVAGLLATGQVTAEELRRLPKIFADKYAKVAGADWLEKAIQVFELAKAEQGLIQ